MVKFKHKCFAEFVAFVQWNSQLYGRLCDHCALHRSCMAGYKFRVRWLALPFVLIFLSICNARIVPDGKPIYIQIVSNCPKYMLACMDMLFNT